MDQPKVKHPAEQISPTGTKYNRQTMEKQKATAMPPHLQTFEHNHQPQGVPKNIPPCSSIHHRTLEYNRQPQGVPTNIYPCSPINHLPPSNTTVNPKESPKTYIHVPPYTTCHHRTLTPLCHLKLSPFWANLTTSSGTKPAHWQYLPGGYPKETDPSPARPPPPP